MNLLNSMTKYIFLSLINMIKSKRLFQVRVINSVSNKDNQKEGAWKDKISKPGKKKKKVITNF